MADSERKKELTAAEPVNTETIGATVQKTKLQRIFARVFKDVKKIIIPVAGIIVYMIPAQLIFHTTCPFAIFTGLPCPGCGITRALLLVLQFRFAEAAQMNFTIYLWIALAVFFVIYRYILEKDNFPNAIFIPIGLTMLVLWIYRMITVFPGPAPMEYRQLNIIRLIYNLIKGMS